MTDIYRIIEHKDNPNQARDLARALGGDSEEAKESVGYAAKSGISEIYRGEIKPTVLQVKPYDATSHTPGRKILVWYENEWWLSSIPMEFGMPDWYIELPELPNPEE